MNFVGLACVYGVVAVIRTIWFILTVLTFLLVNYLGVTEISICIFAAWIVMSTMLINATQYLVHAVYYELSKGELQSNKPRLLYRITGVKEW